MNMSQKLIIVVAGLSLGACSMFEGKNTFMTYQDLQDKVREHDEQWQSVQPKLDRIDELEAQIASLQQQKGNTMDTSVVMPSSKTTMLTPDEAMAAPHVAPAVSPSPVIEENPTSKVATAPMATAPMAVQPTQTMNNNQLAIAASESTVKASSDYGVQVASYSNRDEAIRGWHVLQKKSPNVFDGLVPHVNQKEVKGRTMYQLKVGPFIDKSYSVKFCSMLKGQGTDCLVTKYDGEIF